GSDAGDVSLRLRHLDTWFESSKHGRQQSRATVIDHRGAGSKWAVGCRHVHVTLRRVLRNRRQDADHGVRSIVHSEDGAHDISITVVTALPVFVAEHEHGVTTWLFVIWNEGSAEEWFHAEHVEEVCGDYTGLHPFRLVAAVEYEAHGMMLDHLHRFVLIAIILELLTGEAKTVSVVETSLLIHHDETVSVFVGEWSQQHTVNHAEDRGVGADAQRQSNYGGECKPRIPAQDPQTKLNILLE